MEDPNVTIENLVTLRADLIRCWEGASHITLMEVLNRDQTEQIARLELTSAELGPYIREYDIEPGDTANESQVQALARGAEAWVRSMVVNQMYGRSSARFKLNIWAPKASQCLKSMRFGAVNAGWDDGPLPLPTPSAPSFKGDAELPDFVLRAVKNYLSLVEGSFSFLMSSSRAIISDQTAHLKRLEHRLGELMDHLISGDRLAGAIAQQGAMTAEQARLRGELGKATIEQIGRVTNSLIGGWNKLDPELMELMQLIQDDEALLKTLKHPKVLALLKNAEARASVRGILEKLATAYATPATPDPAPASPASPAETPSEESKK